MFLEERQNKILEQIKQESSIKVNDLSSTYNVSEVTIRRDLEELEKAGLIKRTHGGAIYVQGGELESTFATTVTQNIEVKEKLGKAAAELVTGDSTVFLESSTTVLHIARNLGAKNNLTVVTNSPHIMIELAQHKNKMKIISVAGEFDREVMSIQGYFAEKVLSEMNYDTAFIGISAIDADLMMSTSFPEEARLKQIVMQRSKEVIGIADGTKFGKKFLVPIAPVKRLNCLIVDSSIPEEYAAKVRGQGIKLIVT